MREIYGLTDSKLFGICVQVTQEPNSAEEILQEVYLKVWRRAASFDPARASPITWMCTIARNSAIDWRRAHRAPTMVSDDHITTLADDRMDVEQALSDQQERARIFHCMETLGAKQREAIRSAFFGGLTYAELAISKNVPLGTMKSWVRRGLAQLKDCLGHG
ncbi:sigma-70 family RNA polymerase sigma factor [Sphingomonas sp. Y38-1Y]|uniref:sigma-70 family RNA polymerase sigma factor n=1 Tax=Sphingomonas sp. Y38-1Y TaxID=3078265 RepID=UPI0028EC0957|nr:sigma-70 family RNA polymerase sigma factor [Sphingomonas sp. Y38-1Y]